MKKVNYSRLLTEQPNPRTKHIDRLPLRRVLRIINSEDAQVPRIVRKSLPLLEKAVRFIVTSLENGGRLFFLGAGTSGRLGVLEAAECPPTFNTPPSLVQAIMAGGKASVFRSREGAEDQAFEARRKVNGLVRSGDVVVGIAASGVTPFVHAGLKAAKKKGAKRIFLTCSCSASPRLGEIVISVPTGPEVISGSTRLKAGTATKLILNSLTVASMIQLGKVYGNRMVDCQARSNKLRDRALRLFQELTGASHKTGKEFLKKSKGDLKLAIVMKRKGLSPLQAKKLLRKVKGHLHLIFERNNRP